MYARRNTLTATFVQTATENEQSSLNPKCREKKTFF